MNIINIELNMTFDTTYHSTRVFLFSATFKVKEDFFMYESGVYSASRVVSDSYTGDERRQYHSVRIIGYRNVFYR